MALENSQKKVIMPEYVDYASTKIHYNSISDVCFGRNQNAENDWADYTTDNDTP